MSEAQLRLLVVGLVAFVILAWFLWNGRRRVEVRRVARSGLAPGVILFSSSTCSPCSEARRVVTAVCGEAFREERFEDDPPAFGRFGIHKVPTVAVVDPSGSAVLLEGVPSQRMLRRHTSPGGP